MLFNSIEFIIFILIFFVIYWFIIPKFKFYQNITLLFGSYIFYGWWDIRFLTLIIASTVLDYFVAKFIYTSEIDKHKNYALFLSVFFNLSLLFIFKYFNFFLDSFYQLFGQNNDSSKFLMINIVLPVGISFYTFQTLSYTIDVYNKKINPSNSILDLAVYVSFFPQLVAGPIERAVNFLPQVQKVKEFNYKNAINGLKLILIGFFKKLIIADSFAGSVDVVFSNVDNFSYLSLLIGAVLFSFQIYCDFSGYTDIARGLAKLLGFDLMLNFNFPYFSKSISEFWKRWHISLSTWFRDYLYIPLGGSRVSFFLTLRNIFIIFLVSGLWHGANWTFVAWGAIHALLYLPSYISKKINFSFELPKSLSPIKTLFIFSTVTLAWIFFRSENLNIAIEYCFKIFTLADGRNYFLVENMGLSLATNLLFSILCLIILLIFEYLEFKGRKIKFTPVVSSFVIIFIILFGQFIDDNVFIYFQF